jgi:virginiamycin B lyase
MTIRIPRRTLATVAVAAVVVLALAGTGAWWFVAHRSPPGFVEYPMRQRGEMPIAVAAAADGSVWFTIDGAAALGRVRDGRLEELPKAGKSVEPLGIAAAADGSVWFTDMAAGAVARMTPVGAVDASVPIETPMVRLGRLAVAPDGAVWFAEGTSYSITKIKDGALTRHRFESWFGGPYGVAVAPDGTVWATLQAGNQLIRIAPDGSLKTFNLPRPQTVPTDIAIGPDGAVWFVEFRGNSIGRYKDGQFVDFTVAKEDAGLSGLAVAADGAVWFGMLRASSLGRLRNGELATFKLPRADARPYSLAIDSAGNVWYADIHGYVGMLPADHARD